MATRLKRIFRYGIPSLLIGMFPAFLGATLQHPNLERGFDPENAYEMRQVDDVNLFNGNLIVTIPIGDTYSVGLGGTLTYRLTLTYNLKAWDWEVVPSTGNPSSVLAWASRDSNAGFGWRLSLGQLIPPHTAPRNETDKYLYIDENGAEHLFYDRLAGVPSQSGVYYTNDSSYLRLVLGEPIRVESPDGLVREFNSSGLLTRVTDRLARNAKGDQNALDITYGNNKWTLEDTEGRTHTVSFANQDYDGMSTPMVTRVELAAFGDTTAVYNFSYGSLDFPRPLEHFDTDVDSPLPNPVRLPVLTSVTLPEEGMTYRMLGYHTEAGFFPGALKELELPTKGSIAWTYGGWTFPAVHLPTGGDGSRPPSDHIEITPGVKERRLLTAGGSVQAKWTYTSSITPAEPHPNPPMQYKPIEMVTTVNARLGESGDLHHRKVHFFSAFNGGDVPPEQDALAILSRYGLPYSPKRGSNGLFDSMEVRKANNTLVRTEQLRYTGDAGGATQAQKERGHTNNRVDRQRTIYNDDGGKSFQTTYSDFDGVGHYRKAQQADDFSGEFGTTRTTFTGYNPDGIPDPQEAWVLNTYDKTTVTEGDETVSRQFCFHRNTGVLQRTRMLKSKSSSLTPADDDVIIVYTRAPGSGKIVESYYGGDENEVSVSSDLCGLELPPDADHVFDHTWDAGSLARTQEQGAGFATVNRAIDRNTGLPSLVRDQSEMYTNLEWDRLGRLTFAKPQQRGGAWIRYVYFAPTSQHTQVRVIAFENGHTSTSHILQELWYRYDTLGRLIRQRYLLPDNDWSIRTRRYNGFGWLINESEPIQSGNPDTTPENYTKFFDFDPFGRPWRIVPPDGTDHQVTFTYKGIRGVTRTSKVGTNLGMNQNVTEQAYTVKEFYDPYGRLVQVDEVASDPGDPETALSASYSYDALGELKEAVLLGRSVGQRQHRKFIRDHRGFLETESHPEAATIFYSDYDSRGNVGRRVQGTRELRFSYNDAEQLTKIAAKNNGSYRTLREITYGDNDQGRSLGKVVEEVQHNYVHNPHNNVALNLEVSEEYRYDGIGGRLSHRKTTTSNGRAFATRWVYDDLGNVVELQYPRCTHDDCIDVVSPRLQTFDYYRDKMTGIPGFVEQMTYHPNGMLHTAVYDYADPTVSNMITIDADPFRMLRPGNIRIAGTIDDGGPGAQLGNHEWDGSGNLIRRTQALGTERFAYDPVSRLVHYEMASGATQKYDFDDWGNVRGIERFAPDGTVIDSRSFQTSPTNNRLDTASYDASGNLTQLAGNDFEYDALNRMIHRNHPDDVYVYGASGWRLFSHYLPDPMGVARERWTLRDLDGKVLTIYEFDNEGGGVNWRWSRDYVYRPDRHVVAAATSEPAPYDQLHFFTDHLGSRILTTGSDGKTVSHHFYFGFGEELAPEVDDGDRLMFTGHERDRHSTDSNLHDLDYMLARYYSPYIGRFLSVDPVDSGRPAAPQTWNRYTYALNNPLNRIDPNGEESYLVSRPGPLGFAHTFIVTHASGPGEVGQVRSFGELENGNLGEVGVMTQSFSTGTRQTDIGAWASLRGPDGNSEVAFVRINAPDDVVAAAADALMANQDYSLTTVAIPGVNSNSAAVAIASTASGELVEPPGERPAAGAEDQSMIMFDFDGDGVADDRPQIQRLDPE